MLYVSKQQAAFIAASFILPVRHVIRRIFKMFNVR